MKTEENNEVFWFSRGLRVYTCSGTGLFIIGQLIWNLFLKTTLPQLHWVWDYWRCTSPSCVCSPQNGAGLRICPNLTIVIVNKGGEISIFIKEELKSLAWSLFTYWRFCSWPTLLEWYLHVVCTTNSIHGKSARCAEIFICSHLLVLNLGLPYDLLQVLFLTAFRFRESMCRQDTRKTSCVTGAFVGSGSHILHHDRI